MSRARQGTVDEMVRSGVAEASQEASEEAVFKSSVLNPSITGAAAYYGRTQQLHGGQPGLHGTHNRLGGSRRERPESWLHAFNWSLFPYPLLVWNANEFSESTKHAYERQRNRQR